MRAAVIAWRVSIIGVAVVIVAYLARHLAPVLVPLLVGIVLAAVVRPSARWLREHRIPHVLAVLLPVTALTVAILAAAAGVAYSLHEESEALEQSVRTGLAAANDALNRIQSGLDEATVDRIHSTVTSNASRISSALGRGVLVVIGALGGAALAIVFCFFFLLDLDTLTEGVRKRMAPATYERVSDVSARAWTRLEQYLRGLFITATANAIMMGLALWLIGVPLVLPNMVITFAGSFIPYAGPILATAVASLLALGSGGLLDAALVVGAGAAVQAVEGNVLEPFVVGHAVELPPFATILAITTGAAVAGIIGAFVAVPAAAICVLLYDSLRRTPPDPAAVTDAGTQIAAED